MLEGRHETLKDAIDSVYKRIMADEVLAAMLNDRTTSVHVHERVKEVFSEVITH
jgi:truncated hemoglobin YjbI